MSKIPDYLNSYAFNSLNKSPNYNIYDICYANTALYCDTYIDYISYIYTQPISFLNNAYKYLAHHTIVQLEIIAQSFGISKNKVDSNIFNQIKRKLKKEMDEIFNCPCIYPAIKEEQL